MLNKKVNINFIALERLQILEIWPIIRSAVAFDIDGIIVKSRSFPHKSKLLYKSASGGTEHIKIFRVSNINTALKFKNKEFGKVHLISMQIKISLNTIGKGKTFYFLVLKVLELKKKP